MRRPCSPYLVPVLSGLALSSLLGCAKEKPEGARPAPLPVNFESFRPALTTYADIAHACYADSLASARGLLESTQRLVREPSAETLAQARNAWTTARRPYTQAEVFRFYDGPIDRVELFVNTWPIDENYVEAAQPGLTGIVENTALYPELTPALLTSLNGKDGETSISTGYHVVEFLLWGRDTRADGPGDRPSSDYSEKSPLAARRGQYLRISTELLISQLSELADAWAPARAGNYREKFLALPPATALALALKGMGSLSGPELAGERLTVAYETKDQENEHSCFSDTTHADLLGNAVGIQNLCSGRYERAAGSAVTGAGLCDAIAGHDAKLGETLRTQIAASVAAVRAIPAPFDQAILGNDAAPGRQAVQRAIVALEEQTKTITRVAAKLDLKLTLAVVGGNP
jgi:putative iron-regulated protein